MARKIPPADLNNAVEAYLTGLSSEDASKIFNFSASPLVKELKRRGLLRDLTARSAIKKSKISAKAMERTPLPIDEIAVRYLAGESENSLAQTFNVSRGAIRVRLRKADIELRDQTTANQLMSKQTPIDEHHRRISIAQEATRGRKASLNELLRRAQTKERKPSNRSQAEILLETWLTERGVVSIPQQAIGKYNVDLGTYPVAVEIFGGTWHFTKNHVERFDYIFNAGWHVLIVFVDSRRSVLTPGAADYIVTFLQETTSNPTMPREYRVIWGEGKLCTAGGANSNELAAVIPHRGRHGHGSRN